MRRLVWLLMSGFWLSGCATRPAALPSPAETALVGAMTYRLTIAREVAWNKYLDGKPVRDPQREAEVLATVTAQGAERGLDATRTRRFFQAQIEASCAQQAKLIHLWRRGNSLPSYAPRPLARIREDIDRANNALLAALARLGAEPLGSRATAERDLRRAGIYWRPARIATEPFEPEKR